MKRLERSQLKKLTGGLLESICVDCGGSTGVACMAPRSGWNCSGTDDAFGISCNAIGTEYSHQAYCCPNATGCTPSGPFPDI